MWQVLSRKLRRWKMKTHKRLGRHTSGLSLVLGDLNPDIASSLAAAFADVDAVEVLEGNLLEADCDAIVSPANSFGDMGGGIDKSIDDFYRGAAQSRVREVTAQEFLGELPVGMALVVEMPVRPPRFVVAAPTMRVPGCVDDTINAYLAMRAALVAVLKWNADHADPIKTLAIPGLCTGVGGMPYAVAAQQMRTAYDNVCGGQWRQIVHPAQAPYALSGHTVSKRY